MTGRTGTHDPTCRDRDGWFRGEVPVCVVRGESTGNIQAEIVRLSRWEKQALALVEALVRRQLRGAGPRLSR